MKKFEHFKSNLKVLVTAENEDLSNEFIVGGIIDKPIRDIGGLGYCLLWNQPFTEPTVRPETM